MEHISSKFQQRLESPRGAVCNGEILRRDPLTACRWRRPAGLPAHTHRWTTCRGNLTHTLIREASFLASSERKWDWTRRGRVGEGVNHRANAALHHRFLSPPDHPSLPALSTQRPPSSRFRHVTVDLPTMSLSLWVTGAQVAWHVYGKDSQSTIWKLLILEGDSSGRQGGEDLDWPWLSCIRYVWGPKCFLCFFMHAYLTPVRWRGLFIFAKAHMWRADPLLCLHTACARRLCVCVRRAYLFACVLSCLGLCA